MTTKQLHRHIRKIRRSAIMAIMFLLLSGFSLVSSVKLADYCYDKWISPSGSTDAENVSLLENAISIYPGRVAGYQKILQIYLTDNMLTENEHQHLQSLLTDNQEALNKKENDSDALYRAVINAYACNYTGDTQERFRLTYKYISLWRPYDNATQTQTMVLNAYLTLGAYCEEYIWEKDQIKAPTSTEVTNVLRICSTALNALQQEEAELLAFASAANMIIRHEKDRWTPLVGADAILAVTEDISALQLREPGEPTALRLWEELLSALPEDETKNGGDAG